MSTDVVENKTAQASPANFDTGVGFDYVDLVTQTTTITQIEDEAPDVKTFHLTGQLNAQPGQFVMLWQPVIGSRPFSIFGDDGETFKLTIKKVGPFTEALFERKVGEKLGFNGPFGTAFRPQGKRVALVAGGYGAAPLAFLTERYDPANTTVDFIIGGRSADNLLYQSMPLPDFVTRHYCTNDGTVGFHGTVVDKMQALITSDGPYDMVCSVGPDLMMKATADACEQHDIDYQVSIERYMKCGYGICGSCCVDPVGWRMCVEGPVVGREMARQITEFGHYHRNAAGIKEYHHSSPAKQ